MLGEDYQGFFKEFNAFDTKVNLKQPGASMLRCDLMDAQRQHGPYERAITVRMAEDIEKFLLNTQGSYLKIFKVGRP